VRVGSGYDIHRLVPGRKLILGGVELDYPLGLLGHSDADVLTHSLCDALLGAIGLGDIGEHYPDTDPTWKDVSSLVLLADVVKKMKDTGFELINCDLTVLAQRPKISPYKAEIRKKIARTLGVSIDRVNLKASTTEGLGCVGREEAIAAMSTVLVKRC
jgi:2-C-methyl-D-erythritol 2,4-cyclodiphosphate synthase